MQCDQIRDMLSAYIDGVLDEQETADVENHVRSCSSCYQELIALRETVKLLNSLGEVVPPPEFRSQLMLKVNALPEKTAGGKKPAGNHGLTGVRLWFSGINKYLVAAVLMIGLGIGTGIFQLGILSGGHIYDLASYSSPTKNTAQSTKSDSAGQESFSLQKGKQKASESEAKKIAGNQSYSTNEVSRKNSGTGTLAAKSTDQASVGSTGSADVGNDLRLNDSAGITGSNSSSPENNPATGKVSPETQNENSITAKIYEAPIGIMAADSAQNTASIRATGANPPADSSVNNLPENTKKDPAEYSALRPAGITAAKSTGESAANQAEQKADNAATGTTPGNSEAVTPKTLEPEPKSNPGFKESGSENKVLAKTGESSAVRVARDSTLKDSAQSVQEKSPGDTGQAAGWILTMALLAGGIGCAVYYFYLRWHKS